MKPLKSYKNKGIFLMKMRKDYKKESRILIQKMKKSKLIQKNFVGL